MKRTTLSRRTLLRSAGGIAIGLPWLEQMMPRRAEAQSAAAPKRFVAMFCPNGFLEADARSKGATYGDWRGYWTPATTGAGYAITPTLQPLAALQNDFLFISGLDYTLGSSDHRETACFLTGGKVDKVSNSTLDKAFVNESIDQQIAAVIGKTTKKSSVQLLVNTSPGGDVLYTSVSWRDGVSPQATEHNPKALFDSFFAGFVPTTGGGPSPDQLRASALEKSILDFVSTDASQLKARLGKNDNVKLDQYLDGIRSLEKDLQAPTSSVGCNPGSGPAVTTDFPTTLKNAMDVLVLGMQCDVTRVASLMIGIGRGGPDCTFLGLPGDHHAYSHYLDDPSYPAACAVIEKWEMQQLAYLLQKMKSVTEVDGKSLLDNSAVLMGSDIADGNSHGQKGMTYILAGKAGGKLAPGRHLKYPSLSTSNLLLSILQAFDVPVASMNNSTGTLAGLAG
jgi:hypothetical protein